jgi:ABC-type amino acid transport substrate-binding protein
MKKIILVLSLLMGILLVGCGSKKDEKKVVYVGTNAEFAPFEFLEGDILLLLSCLSNSTAPLQA